jgi:hypothetical protein
VPSVEALLDLVLQRGRPLAEPILLEFLAARHAAKSFRRRHTMSIAPCVR